MINERQQTKSKKKKSNEYNPQKIKKYIKHQRKEQLRKQKSMEEKQKKNLFSGKKIICKTKHNQLKDERMEKVILTEVKKFKENK